MGWVDSSKLFCAFLETLADLTNTLLDTELPVLSYVTITKIPITRPPYTPHTREYHHIDCYIYDIISAVQGRTKRQQRIFDGTVCALNELFPSLPGYSKDSASVKKILAGEGNWTCVKEVLG